MNRFFAVITRPVKLIFATALLVSGAAPVSALPITYTFTGTVQAGTDPVNTPVTGTFTFNPSTFTANNTDSNSYQSGYAAYLPNSMNLAGNASTAFNSVTIGNGNQFDYAEAAIARQFGGFLNEFYFYGQSQSCDVSGCGGTFITLDIYDYAGNASTLFADASSGVNYMQDLNLGSGETASFEIGTYTGTDSYVGGFNSFHDRYRAEFDEIGTPTQIEFDDIGNLNSIDLVNNPFNVPEPATPALLGVAALALGWARSRRNS